MENKSKKYRSGTWSEVFKKSKDIKSGKVKGGELHSTNPNMISTDGKWYDQSKVDQFRESFKKRND